MACFPVLSLFAVLAAAAALPGADAARILGVFPHPGKTHFLVFEPLLLKLAERGHEVVVISHYPQKEPTPRYTDIDVSGSHVDLGGKIDLTVLQNNKADLSTGINDFLFITDYGLSSCDAILGHPAVKKLIASDEKFDLIINEAFNTHCFLGLVHRFRPAPYIAMSSCMLMGWDWWRVGNPRSPAIFPYTFLWFTNEMTFSQRLVNTLFTLGVNTYKERVLDRQAQLIAGKHFGPGMPSLHEIAKNVSLILINSNPALNTPRPLVPAVVEVGGLHIQPAVRPLPKDLEEFVAGAKDGVIMFSMGSMIRASSLPQENAAAILKALGTLKQRVVWKWEADPPGPVPKNVRMLKWIPQFDVLCHNNTRLFIGHGGLLSTSEAAYCGVPLLGIAMYGDQRTNMAAVSKAGAARAISYSTLKDATGFLRHINEMLSDSSFKENAKILSERFRDRPMSPLDTAVYWTEYVIRHKGAPHLRGAARDLSWWQEALLDVIAVVALAAAALLVLVIAMVRSLLRLLCSLGGSCGKQTATKQKKA